jgi:hypothetical protein
MGGQRRPVCVDNNAPINRSGQLTIDNDTPRASVCLDGPTYPCRSSALCICVVRHATLHSLLPPHSASLPTSYHRRSLLPLVTHATYPAEPRLVLMVPDDGVARAPPLVLVLVALVRHRSPLAPTPTPGIDQPRPSLCCKTHV